MTGRVIRKNNNNLISYIGKTGSGKTWAAMATAEIMSVMTGVPFDVDNIVFTLKELMDLINSKKLKRGSVIIFDEPQVSIGAREFQSMANKVFNLLVSTFRHRNFTLFFCTPFEKLLDKNTRMLFHGRFETMSIDTNTKTCRLKPRFLEYSDFKAEPYRKQLIVQFKNEQGLNQSKKLSYWDVPKPNKELIDAYEEKKLAFTTNLNKNITNSLKEFDESGKSMTSDSNRERRKPLTDKQRLVMETLANSNYKETCIKLGMSLGGAAKHKELALKKGYVLEEFKNKEEISQII